MSQSPRSSLRNTVLLTVSALLAVALLAGSSIVLASRLVTSEVRQRVQTTAAVSSVVVGQQTTSLAALVHSYATQPSLVTGLASGKAGDASISATLGVLDQAVPGIVGAFIATLAGSSAYVYPPQPTVIGRNFAFRDWYKGLVASNKVYVSEAIQTAQTNHPLAITIVDYIRGFDGVPLAIIGVNYRLDSIRAFSADIARVQGITLTMSDRAGTSLNTIGPKGLVSLAADPTVRAARAGRTGLLSYAPARPGEGHGPKVLSAYTPVTGPGWTVTASIPHAIAFAGLGRLRWTVLAITALLVLILLVGAWVMARSDRRQRHSELQIRTRDRELARILESTDEGFVSVDGLGVITAWNTRAEELYGWEAAEVTGRNVADIIFRAGLLQ